jgi:hypothetical protein
MDSPISLADGRADGTAAVVVGGDIGELAGLPGEQIARFSR